MVELYICDERTLRIAEHFWDYLPCVAQEEQEKALRFVHMEDRVRSLTAALLRRIVTCKKTGLSEPAFQIGAYGKPYLAGMPHVHFNLSHAGELVIFAWADDPVGVDVEPLRPIELTPYLCFFSEAERQRIRQSVDPVDAFFLLWTSREAFAKRDGTGLSLFENGGDFRLTEGTASYGNETCAAKSLCYQNHRISLCFTFGEKLRLTVVSAEEWEEWVADFRR